MRGVLVTAAISYSCRGLGQPGQYLSILRRVQKSASNFSTCCLSLRSLTTVAIHTPTHYLPFFHASQGRKKWRLKEFYDAGKNISAVSKPFGRESRDSYVRS